MIFCVNFIFVHENVGPKKCKKWYGKNKFNSIQQSKTNMLLVQANSIIGKA